MTFVKYWQITYPQYQAGDFPVSWRPDRRPGFFKMKYNLKKKEINDQRTNP